MKYEITPITEKSTFKPFTLTLTFETEEEYVDFHDNVLGQITKTSFHSLHSDVYNAGHGDLKNAVKGEI